jgi:AbrB family looped-hinge helix DNA binding protein
VQLTDYIQMKRETAVVTTKGQMVIPARLRRLLGIEEGTTLVITEEKGRLVIQPITAGFIRGLRGSLKREPSALASLSQERKRGQAA